MPLQKVFILRTVEPTSTILVAPIQEEATDDDGDTDDGTDDGNDE